MFGNVSYPSATAPSSSAEKRPAPSLSPPIPPPTPRT